MFQGVFLLFSACWVLFQVNQWKSDIDFVQSFCGELTISQNNQTSKTNNRVRGYLSLLAQERWELRGAHVFVGGKWKKLRGAVRLLEKPQFHLSHYRLVEAFGELHCSSNYQNFSAQEDYILFRRGRNVFFKNVAFFKQSEITFFSLVLGLGSRFRSFIDRGLGATPDLGGIVWAVWTGETSRLDPRLTELYTRGGLLPLIALSGQHVSVFVLLCRFLIGFFSQLLTKYQWFRKHYRNMVLFLPVAACFVLTITSFGTPSVLRTLAMAISALVLRWRCRTCSIEQLLFSSSAILIAINPSLCERVSFILSLNGAYLLVELSRSKGPRGLLRNYVLDSLMMSVTVVPVVLFYFGQWSYLAPVCAVLLNWLWALIIIPAGFLVPIVTILPEPVSTAILQWGDASWRVVVEMHLYFEKTVSNSSGLWIRFTVAEALLLQVALLFFVKSIFSDLSRDSTARY